jgi:2'-5' RNA ligase
MKRTFLAIQIPFNEEFLEYHKNLKTALQKDNIKWVEKDLLHLTIQFFGNIPGHYIKKYIEDCKTVIPTIPSFECAFTELGIFGSKYAPKVLWLGMTAEEELKQMKQQLLQAFIQNGYKPDRQNFVPHLTLGRIKQIQSKQYFQKVMDKYRQSPDFSFTIKKVHLYESILHKEGPEYKTIESFELK